MTGTQEQSYREGYHWTFLCSAKPLVKVKRLQVGRLCSEVVNGALSGLFLVYLFSLKKKAWSTYSHVNVNVFDDSKISSTVQYPEG